MRLCVKLHTISIVSDTKLNYFLIVQILISAIKIPSRQDMDPENEFYCSFPCHGVIERP